MEETYIVTDVEPILVIKYQLDLTPIQADTSSILIIFLPTFFVVLSKMKLLPVSAILLAAFGANALPAKDSTSAEVAAYVAANDADGLLNVKVVGVCTQVI